jgi:hypothetical protein
MPQGCAVWIIGLHSGTFPFTDRRGKTCWRFVSEGPCAKNHPEVYQLAVGMTKVVLCVEWRSDRLAFHVPTNSAVTK